MFVQGGEGGGEKKDEDQASALTDQVAYLESSSF